jgi:hypothetical protein
MKMFCCLLVSAVLAIGAVPQAGADISLGFEVTDENDGGWEDRMMVQGSMLRLESDGDASVHHLVDTESDRLILVSSSERQWMAFGIEDIDRMQAQLSAMREQIEAQLERLPEAQRDMVRQQMEQHMPAADGGEYLPVPEITDTGETRLVAGVRCRVHRVAMDGRTIQEQCVASAGDLDIPPEDAQTLMSAMNMFHHIARRVAASLGGLTDGATVIPPIKDGIPVEVRDFQEGTVHRLTAVSRDALDAGLFEIPEGYRQVDPMAGIPGR